MKNIIIAIVALAVIGGGIYWIATLNTSDAPLDSGATGTVDQNAPVNGLEVRGVVTGVDLQQAMVDGPYVLVVRQDNGDEINIVVPSMGIMTCAAHANIASVPDIKVGMTVEAKGSLAAQGGVIPCEQPSHYLRVVKK